MKDYHGKLAAEILQPSRSSDRKVAMWVSRALAL